MKLIKSQWIPRVLFVMMLASVSPVFAGDTVKYGAQDKRDPFVPLLTESSALLSVEGPAVQTVDDIKIEGVVFDQAQGSLVIINGQVMREGEELNGIKIIRIAANGVEVMVNNVSVFKEIYVES